MRKFFLLGAALGAAAPLLAQGVAPDPAQNAQGDVAVTIYNNDRALVEDKRVLNLSAGRSRQEFRDVSAQIQPQTVTLSGRGVGIVEQNFDFDLLSPSALMQNAVVRATSDGIVIQTADGIEALRCTGLPETVLASQVPAGLSAKPTLSVRVRSPAPVERTVTLSYITNNFDWQANVAGGALRPAADRDRLGFTRRNLHPTAIEPSSDRLGLSAGEPGLVAIGQRQPGEQ